jgi:hypothetical protein
MLRRVGGLGGGGVCGNRGPRLSRVRRSAIRSRVSQLRGASAAAALMKIYFVACLSSAP